MKWQLIGNIAGKSIESDEIVASVLAKIPVPKNGKDGIDGKDAAPLDTDSVVERVLKLLPDPVPGINGKDAPPIDTKALADEVTQKVLGQIPPPINGKDGKDALAVDTKALSEEIVGKVLSQIPAPINGKDGRDGNDGESPNADDIVKAVLAQIPPPIPGKNGKDIDAEALNVRIASEVSKAIAALPKPAAGRDGRDGRAGEQGEPGKDAAEIDILNGMDESASYQRGTYVKHRNGTFRAYRTTDPVVDKNFEAAGWMCVQSSIVDIVEALGPDQRTVIKTHEFSDGSIITSQYKSAAMVYRDVFKEGQFYETGDVVTTAGSSWVCRAPTNDKPGISKNWTLSTKRGSDGKDLRPRDENDVSLNGKGSVYLGAKR